MRMPACYKQRMQRALHGRWPYRRSHGRHDLHWLVRVKAPRCWCPGARTHPLSALPSCSRRPQAR